MTDSRGVTIGILATALATGELGAQQPWRAQAALTMAQVRAHTTLPPLGDLSGTTEQLSGAGFGVEGAVGFSRVGLALRYLEASLTPRDPLTLERQLAEAELMLQFAITPWLSLLGGPHLRWYGTAGYDQRWVLWEVRVRAERSIVPDRVDAYAILWPVLQAATINVPERWSSGAGGEVGLTAGPRRLPVWIRLGYRLELFKLDGGNRRELSDGLTAALGLRPLEFFR